MYGTPYWGKAYFEDLRNLDNIESKYMTISQINDLCKTNSIKYVVEDLYSLFLVLGKLNFLYVIEDEGTWLSWCKDIRFNYRDRLVVVPYYTYKTTIYTMDRPARVANKLDIIEGNKINLPYEYELKTLTIDDRDLNKRISKVVVYDYINKEKYTISLFGLNLIKAKTFSLSDLHDRYLYSSWDLKSFKLTADNEYSGYLRIGKGVWSTYEYILRRKAKLKHYGKNYIDLDYTDCRQYTFLELSNGSVIPFDDVEDYWLRRYRFEALLYCIMSNNLEVEEEEYKTELNKLRLGKIRTFTYIKNDKPLILKHYYVKAGLFRRMSYERYKVRK